MGHRTTTLKRNSVVNTSGVRKRGFIPSETASETIPPEETVKGRLNHHDRPSSAHWQRTTLAMVLGKTLFLAVDGQDVNLGPSFN